MRPSALSTSALTITSLDSCPKATRDQAAKTQIRNTELWSSTQGGATFHAAINARAFQDDPARRSWLWRFRPDYRNLKFQPLWHVWRRIDDGLLQQPVGVAMS